MASETRGRDVLVLDMHGLVDWVDYLVIATGSSRRQIAAIADETERAIRELGDEKIGIEGYEHGKWVVLDFADVVVHVFNDEARDYYQLEHLWGDAPRVDWHDSSDGAESPSTR